ncbi:MAG: 5-(carboxyamino)imidazole ribonucleotide synthase [Armatimonadetes bacterium]|nr:5-(carboxyamino)imidazole ribonucleotide synthase [Armatimonadota bacterium]
MESKFDLGFLGGGQLARMSIQAAQRMGLRCISLDPSPDSPASQIADSIAAPLDDEEALARLLRSSAFVTWDSEFVPVMPVRSAASAVGLDLNCVVPRLETLTSIQDKLAQRKLYEAAGLPSPHAVAMTNAEAVEKELPYPMVLKARFGGYDGKGTRFVKSREELEALRPVWEGGGWLAEATVPFVRELAQMVVRTAAGVKTFPTMETRQENFVCDLVVECARDATEVAVGAVEAMNGIGLFGVEMFELANGEVMINEVAPRPHNSGHYTLDWGGISQFECHVRACLGLPIPEISGTRHTCMANLLGLDSEISIREIAPAALTEPGTFLHWYEKKESRKGRKMGHLNAYGDTVEQAVQRAELARKAFYEAWRKA